MQRAWNWEIWLAHHPQNGLLFILGFVIGFCAMFWFPGLNNGTVKAFWLLIYPWILVLSLAVNVPWGQRAAHGWWSGPSYSFLLGAAAVSACITAYFVALVPALLVSARSTPI